MLNGASPWWTTGRSYAETSRCEIRKVSPKVILARLPILQVGLYPSIEPWSPVREAEYHTTQPTGPAFREISAYYVQQMTGDYSIYW